MNNNSQLLSSASYCVVLVSASSQAQAEELAIVLVKSQLAACVSFLPITSIYTWHEQLHQDQEWQLIIKTKQTLFAEITAKVQEIHSYEVPEIIAIPLIAGSPSYLQWISKQVEGCEEV
ncbi:MAG: divalent-cation tolerance protein CutA [Chroococcus sp. CMT-3BRIN-NPC107]|jgi:periplasmic divalent cation tolerance protein|nr:divalent-cation tolerance protein CutA [Chroococcus sp. CMT-3BRIN-NPC107]